ncbi:MAG: hypothetical protein QNJ68_08015 [Microcoleaceae cyanobacterium MO_207.B10]|nr:hypothetical protein [Microcoleaceae cyanobacterium MO_207.B10]
MWKSELPSDFTKGTWRGASPEYLRARMTPSKIKTIYPESQWQEVAQHFGYSLAQIQNAKARIPATPKSVRQILKEMQN